MAVLTTQHIVDAGTKPNFALDTVGVSNTAEIGNGRNTFLVVKNASGASITVTVVVPGNVDYGQATPDPVFTVAATTGEAWIPLRQAFYDPNAGVGRATVTVSLATSVTAAVVQLG